MCINVTETVDSNGRVMLPCIKEWQHPKSDLYLLLNMMSIQFGQQTPLYARSANASPAVAATAAAVNQPHQYYGGGGGMYGAHTPQPPMPSQQQANMLPYPVADAAYRPHYPGMPSSMPSSMYQPAPVAGYHPSPMNDHPGVAVASNYPMSSNNPYYPMPTPQPSQAISHLKSATNPAPSGVASQGRPGMQPAVTNSAFAGQGQVGGDDTIKPEYYRMSLISAVEDKVKKRMSEWQENKLAQIDYFKTSKSTLEKNERNLNALIAETRQQCASIGQLTVDLRRRCAHMSESMSRSEHRDKASIEDAIVTPTPLYRQLLQLFAEEMALQDLIFYLGQGLTHKTVSLENFLKQIRLLTRKQFMLRATMNRARERAMLPL